MAAEQQTIKRSRIGKLPIALPQGVEVHQEGQALKVKGPKGELSMNLPAIIGFESDEKEARLVPLTNDRESRAMHGLSRSLLSNLVVGVTQGYVRELEINGIGYRAEVKGQFLVFQLGYSHPIFFELPDGVSAEVSARDTRVKLTGIDKQLVGLVASKIRSLRKPEPYKGKGIKYAEEVIIRKAGKSAGR